MNKQIARLTPRQREIIELKAQDLTNHEVADHLGLTYDTVRVQMYEARQRAGVKTTGRLIYLLDK